MEKIFWSEAFSFWFYHTNNYLENFAIPTINPNCSAPETKALSLFPPFPTFPSASPSEAEPKSQGKLRVYVLKYLAQKKKNVAMLSIILGSSGFQCVKHSGSLIILENLIFGLI